MKFNLKETSECLTVPFLDMKTRTLFYRFMVRNEKIHNYKKYTCICSHYPTSGFKIL